MSRWYRVNDPQSPLFGCDVRLVEEIVRTLSDREPEVYGAIDAIRRVDFVVGDRPLQMVSAPGDSLGLLIGTWQLEDSPIQDDVVEMSRESPYGKFVDETEYSKGQYDLTIVRFEHAIQAVLRDRSLIIAKNTWINGDQSDLSDLEGRLCNMLGGDPANLEQFIITGGQPNG